MGTLWEVSFSTDFNKRNAPEFLFHFKSLEQPNGQPINSSVHFCFLSLSLSLSLSRDQGSRFSSELTSSVRVMS